jgi:hypothetical protein
MPKKFSSNSAEKNAISVELLGERLVVTMGDTAYRAVFYKHPNEPRIVEANGLAVDKEAPMYHAEFEDLAWEAANAKARDLGWIGSPGS